MKFFLVFQNQTYKEERQGGYLWAPIENEKGQTFFHWTNMTKVDKGDIIFSSYNGDLVSLGVAQDKCYKHEKPDNFDTEELWQKNGWMIDVKYYDLDNPITFKDYMSNILELQLDIYYPFQKNGRGGNVGYLFETGSALANYLIYIAKQHQKNPVLVSLLENIEVKTEDEVINHIENNISKDIKDTEKEQLIKTRIGQGIFRNKLEKLDCQCKVCGLKFKKLLIASHIKPWQESSNKERLDVYNGFLLCPSHDKLFDKGFISFCDKGEIIISDIIEDKDKELLNINSRINVEVMEEHKKYLKWHRENVFEKWKEK